MKRYHNLLKIALVALSCAVLCARTSVAQSHQDDKVGFKWGFAAKVGPEGDRKFVSIRKDTIMHSNDSVKMVIELTKPCFVYVVHQDPSGGLELLFPYTLTQFTKDYTVGKNYFIPKGQDWSYLDQNVGKEIFHVLASAERLTDFEVAYTKYIAATGTYKNDMAKKVLAQIRSTKKQYRLYASAAERPINIGGNVRGLVTPQSKQPDVTDVEVGISSKSFYTKTFTIDHQK